MTYPGHLAGLLAFRADAARSLASGPRVAAGAVVFAAGFVAHALIRRHVYAGLLSPAEDIGTAAGLFRWGIDLGLLQALAFAVLLYVPVLLALANAITGAGPGFTFSRAGYESQLSACLPLWGLILLVSGTVQGFAPQIYLVDPAGVGIAIGAARIVLLALLALYTVWALRTVNRLSWVASVAVLILSAATFPLYYLLDAFPVALPVLLLLAALFLALRRKRHARRDPP